MSVIISIRAHFSYSVFPLFISSEKFHALIKFHKYPSIRNLATSNTPQKLPSNLKDINQITNMIADMQYFNNLFKDYYSKS